MLDQELPDEKKLSRKWDRIVVYAIFIVFLVNGICILDRSFNHNTKEKEDNTIEHAMNALIALSDSDRDYVVLQIIANAIKTQTPSKINEICNNRPVTNKYIFNNCNNMTINKIFLRYLVFYTAFDIGYSISKFLPVKLVFSVMKEIYRCKKVHDGVLHAAKLYPNAYIIMVLIGTLKGNDASFTKIIERLLRGVWTPTSIETLQPSFTTKACINAIISEFTKWRNWHAAHIIIYWVTAYLQPETNIELPLTIINFNNALHYVVILGMKYVVQHP